MRLRLIEQRDVDACLSIWPMHGIEHTEAVEALERALSTQRLAGAVIEHPHTQERLGFGVSAFVRGATLDEAAAAGVPLVEHVLRAEAAGSSRLLTPDMTPQAGRALDLHLLVLAYRQRSFDMDDPQARELLQVGHTAYRLMHEGYPLRGVWQEGEPSDADWMGAGGYLVKRHYLANGAAGRILFGTLREDVTPAWPSHTVSFLFHGQAARLRLTPMQRQVATLGLWSLNDAQVAQRLGISAETVRRHWRGIFERIDDVYPALLADPPRDAAAGGRGPEKRVRALDFLRINLQEVRPGD